MISQEMQYTEVELSLKQLSSLNLNKTIYTDIQSKEIYRVQPPLGSAPAPPFLRVYDAATQIKTQFEKGGELHKDYRH